MSARDVLLRPLDASGLPIGNLGAPAAKGDATFTDNETTPALVGGSAGGRPGASFRAAPADHVHPSAAPMRIVAAGRTTMAAGARVTLATFQRAEGEVVPASGFAWVRDDVKGVTWEGEVEGATHVSTYHERTASPNEAAFRAVNAGSAARTIDWATVALHAP